MFEMCVQAVLSGCGRCSRVIGAVRATDMGCATMVQIHIKGLPDSATCGFLQLRIETCRRCIVLAPVKISGCEAMLTYLDNSFTPQEIQGAEIILAEGDMCRDTLARGVFSACPHQPSLYPECPRTCRRPYPSPVCPPLYPRPRR